MRTGPSQTRKRFPFSSAGLGHLFLVPDSCDCFDRRHTPRDMPSSTDSALFLFGAAAASSDSNKFHKKLNTSAATKAIPMAPPGSHSSAMKVARKGLKMSHPSAATTTTTTTTTSTATTTSLPRVDRPTIHSSNPSRLESHPNQDKKSKSNLVSSHRNFLPDNVVEDLHIWSRKARPRSRHSAAGSIDGTMEEERWEGPASSNRLPLQSPVRKAEWWRRPPSPLAFHMRPLWESSSGSGYVSDDSPSAVRDRTSPTQDRNEPASSGLQPDPRHQQVSS